MWFIMVLLNQMETFMELVNHYKWLEKYLPTFWKAVFDKSLEESGCAGIISAHGDKGYQYKSDWEDAGIPFPHGMAIYFMTYTEKMDRPKHESCEWVIENYRYYSDLLPHVDENDMDVVCPFALAQLKDQQEGE